MTNSRTRVLRTLFWIFAGLISTLCLAYLTDFAVLRWKFANKRNPMATVTVKPYYAVPRKDHKEEYMFDDPFDETCVNSLFPHAGSRPCWYVTRHKSKRIDL